MLNKDPLNRPSAEQLYLESIPELLKPIQEKEGILPPPDPLVQDNANTKLPYRN